VSGVKPSSSSAFSWSPDRDPRVIFIYCAPPKYLGPIFFPFIMLEFFWIFLPVVCSTLFINVVRFFFVVGRLVTMQCCSLHSLLGLYSPPNFVYLVDRSVSPFFFRLFRLCAFLMFPIVPFFFSCFAEFQYAFCSNVCLVELDINPLVGCFL